MANNDMKRYPVLSRKCKLNHSEILLHIHLILELLRGKRMNIPSIGKVLEELSYTAGGNIKWYYSLSYC